MGSLSPLRLPIVNFTEERLNSGAAGADIRRALEEFGCFEAVVVVGWDDKVMSDPELRKAMFGVVEDFFNLPLEIKSQKTTDKPYHGYIGIRSHSPLYESVGIADATVLESTQSFTNLIWPPEKTSYSEVLHSYATKASELEKMVKKLVFESYGMGKYYESHAESISYNLRIMKYKAPMTDETKPAAATHTDKTYLTILQQNHVDGVELETKAGEWFRVTPSSPSSFIVMVGDGLYAWTNGRVHCPRHRVTMRGNETRYSIGVFAYSNDLVECPKELVDEEHPLLFKPFDQMGLLGFYSTVEEAEDQTADSLLNAYCGVSKAT